MSRHVFISPHPDDAILSCGEYIEKLVNQGEQVLVMTVFTEQPDSDKLSEGASQFHEECGLGYDAYKTRRQEDIRAVNCLKCQYMHLPFFECLYRQDKNGVCIYSGLDEIFDFKEEYELENCTELQERLASELKTFEYVYAPAAIGNHADHKLVNYIVSRIKKDLNGELYYYLDFPYSIFERCNSQVNDYLQRYEKIIVDISDQEIEKKVMAISQYSSQIDFLFDSKEGMIESVKYHAKRFSDNGYAFCLLKDIKQ